MLLALAFIPHLRALQHLRGLLHLPPNSNFFLDVSNLEGESILVLSKRILLYHSCRFLQESVEQDIQCILTARQSQLMRAFTCFTEFITAATIGYLCALRDLNCQALVKTKTEVTCIRLQK